jgi:hypothetical protein
LMIEGDMKWQDLMIFGELYSSFHNSHFFWKFPNVFHDVVSVTLTQLHVFVSVLRTTGRSSTVCWANTVQMYRSWYRRLSTGYWPLHHSVLQYYSTRSIYRYSLSTECVGKPTVWLTVMLVLEYWSSFYQVL